MAGYDDLRAWCKTHELIVNRCKVINDVTLDLADIRERNGGYSLRLFGREVARWRIYDLRSVEDAYQRADAVFRVLWDARRCGYADFAAR